MIESHCRDMLALYLPFQYSLDISSSEHYLPLAYEPAWQTYTSSFRYAMTTYTYIISVNEYYIMV